MNLNKDIDKVLISKEEIDKKVEEIGQRITEDYPNHDEDLVIVGVLKGASVFVADLIRKIDRPIELDFMSVSSYGLGRTESTGRVRIMKDLDSDIKDKHLILAEDIVDTGLTLSYLSDLMERRGAKSIKIASLLSKEARREKEVKIDYLGFDIPDEFVVGYGIDFSEGYRNLEFIGTLKPEVYENL